VPPPPLTHANSSTPTRAHNTLHRSFSSENWCMNDLRNMSTALRQSKTYDGGPCGCLHLLHKRVHPSHRPQARACHAGVLEVALPAPCCLAVGGKVIKCRYPLNLIKDTYDHSCY
jgi:hypothetical protein